MFSSKTDQWATPQDFFNKLDEEFHFTLDPCADEFNHKCNTYFTIEDDGLKQDWSGNIVFCNPPYSNLKEWIIKCHESALRGTTCVMLIPSRTDTQVMHEYVFPYCGLNAYKPEYQYYAGLFDGEGCVRIDRQNPSNKNRNRKPSYSLSVMLKMTDEKTVKSIKNYFKCGKIYIETFEYKKTTYKWECYANDAKNFLELLYPYLKTKKSQAYYAIQFQTLANKKTSKINSDEILNKYDLLYEKVKKLKKIDDNIWVEAEIRFIKGRLKFGESKNAAPFPSMVVVFRGK